MTTRSDPATTRPINIPKTRTLSYYPTSCPDEKNHPLSPPPPIHPHPFLHQPQDPANRGQKLLPRCGKKAAAPESKPATPAPDNQPPAPPETARIHGIAGCATSRIRGTRPIREKRWQHPVSCISCTTTLRKSRAGPGRASADSTIRSSSVPPMAGHGSGSNRSWKNFP